MTDSSVGDGVDNDCDGDQDEDICYPEYGAIREGTFIGQKVTRGQLFNINDVISIAKDSHIFSTKNYSLFAYVVGINLTK